MKSQSHIIAGQEFTLERIKSLRGSGYHWQIIHVKSGYDCTCNFKHDTLENALNDITHVAKLRGNSWESDWKNLEKMEVAA